MRFSANVLLVWLCLNTLAVKTAKSVTLLFNTPPVGPSHTLDSNSTSNSSAIPNNNWPPEPYMYRIRLPHSQLTLDCMYYGHALNNPGIIDLLRTAYAEASFEKTLVGPMAFIGEDVYVFTNDHLGLAFTIQARNSHMCWAYFLEVTIGFQQLVSRFGAIVLEFKLNHDVYGEIAEGTFEGIRGME